MANAFQWLTENWMELAAVAGSVAGSASVLVGTIAAYTKWKGDDKASKALKWVHDKLSPFALGNQVKKLPE